MPPSPASLRLSVMIVLPAIPSIAVSGSSHVMAPTTAKGNPTRATRNPMIAYLARIW